MKKILFIIPEYSHGGVCKSLENLISFIKDDYIIRIFCLHEDGTDYYKNKFRSHIIKKSLLYRILHDNVYTRKFYGAYMKVFKNANWNWLYKNEMKRLQKVFDFDVVIAYQEDTSTLVGTFYPRLNKKIKKIAWMHLDYAIFSDNGSPRQKQIYSSYDKVVCVSETAAESFLNIMSPWPGQVDYLYNFIDTDSITKNASCLNENVFKNRKNEFKIISVGRFAEVKQFEKIPEILHSVIDNVKRRVHWYIMAAGNEMREETEHNIAKYGLNEYITILSAKDNPYSYIKAADLFVCTSYSESFSYVIAEAKVLHVPVLSNDFPVAYEVVEDTCGWICNLSEMGKYLINIVNDVNSCYSNIKQMISLYQYDNKKLKNKFKLIINE